MQSVAFDAFFEGALSIEKGDGWWHAWRLPHTEAPLFPAPDDGLMIRAAMGSGVRLRFKTDTQNICLLTEPLVDHAAVVSNRFDVTIDGELVVTASANPGEESVSIEGIPAGTKILELWLPHGAPVLIREMQIDDGCKATLIPDDRKKWVTYGSSLTHCVRAHSPSRTWPAIVARRYNLNLTSLGFGGQCHLDPMVGMVIRDMPADFISLKLGINCQGAGSLSPRTYPAAIVGLVKTIREKHPVTPIALVSPIASPPRETELNQAGISLSMMREEMEDVHSRLIGMGDENLYYFDGLKVFSEEEIAEYAPDDQVHPSADGIELQAENFAKTVMENVEF